jgi:uncharacterized coiled-coil protein SlyX
MIDPTYADATARTIETQARELRELRALVTEQAHTIRGQSLVIAGMRETITAQQLRIQRLQTGIAAAMDEAKAHRPDHVE